MSKIVHTRRSDAPEKVCNMAVAEEETIETDIRHIQSISYTVSDTPRPAAGRPPMRSELLAREGPPIKPR